MIATAGVAGSKDLLTGFLESENLSSRSFRKVDKDKPTLVEQVVLTTFVDDAYEIVLGRPRIGQDSIDLAKDQGDLILVLSMQIANLFAGRFMAYPGNP